MIVKKDLNNRTIEIKISEKQRRSVKFVFDKQKETYTIFNIPISFTNISTKFCNDGHKCKSGKTFICFDRMIMQETYRWLNLEFIENKFPEIGVSRQDKIATQIASKSARLVSYVFNKEKLDFIEKHEIDIYKLMFNKTGHNCALFFQKHYSNNECINNKNNSELLINKLKPLTCGSIFAEMDNGHYCELAKKSLQNIKRTIGRFEIRNIERMCNDYDIELKSFYEYLALNRIEYFFYAKEDIKLIWSSPIIKKMISKYKRTKKGSRKISDAKSAILTLFPTEKEIIKLDPLTGVLVKL